MRAARPALRPADLSAGNPGGAELGLSGAAWDRGEVSRRVTLALDRGWRMGGRLGSCASPTPAQCLGLHPGGPDAAAR